MAPIATCLELDDVSAVFLRAVDHDPVLAGCRRRFSFPSIFGPASPRGLCPGAGEPPPGLRVFQKAPLPSVMLRSALDIHGTRRVAHAHYYPSLCDPFRRPWALALGALRYWFLRGLSAPPSTITAARQPDASEGREGMAWS
jgi:hypothetical protein